MDGQAEKMGMGIRWNCVTSNVYRPGDTTLTGQDPEVYALPEILDKLCPKHLFPTRRDSLPPVGPAQFAG